PMPVGLHQVSLLQEFQMTRDGRPREVEVPRQLPGRHVAAAQQADDLTAGRIGEDLDRIWHVVVTEGLGSCRYFGISLISFTPKYKSNASPTAGRAEHRRAVRRPTRAMGGDPPGRSESLGDLDGVESGALAEVVADHPQVDSTRLPEGGPNSPDQDLVAAGRIESGRHPVDPQFAARGIGQHLERLTHSVRSLEEQDATDPVTGDRRSPDTGRFDGQPRYLPDLAAFVDEFPLLVGVPLLGLLAGVRQGVEGDGADVHLRAGILPGS